MPYPDRQLQALSGPNQLPEARVRHRRSACQSERRRSAGNSSRPVSWVLRAGLRGLYRPPAHLAGPPVLRGDVGHVGDRVTGSQHRPLGRIHKGPATCVRRTPHTGRRAIPGVRPARRSAQGARKSCPVAAAGVGAVFTQTGVTAALRYLTGVAQDRHVAGVGASAAVHDGGK